jgi:hypothetical protein
MSACTSGIEQKFFRDGLFFILANTPLGVVRRMEESRRPDMGGGGKGEPPEVRGERVISEVVERPNIFFYGMQSGMHPTTLGRRSGYNHEE